MWFTTKLKGPSSPLAASLGRGNYARPKSTFRPRLEGLEDRSVPSQLVVTNTSDSGSGSLRSTISSAKDGDTILFDASLQGQTITLIKDQLTINKDLDIEGPGAGLLAISGNDTNRIFNINEGLTVRIDGLTITHGRAGGGNGNQGGAGGGGAILNVGSTLSLANDVFSSNVSLGSSGGPKGGAIANYGTGSLTVTDSTFIGNLADGRVKKGNFAEGGAIFSTRDGPSITAIRCTFTANQAIGGDGGVLAPGQFAIGTASGGALHIEGASSTLTVIDCTFVSNQAIGGSGGSAGKGNSLGAYAIDSGEGGAIVSHDGGTLIIDGSQFVSNHAVGGYNASGASVTLGFLGMGIGGGLDCEGPATITNSSFVGNEAVGGSGNTGGSGLILVGVGFGGGLDNESFGFAASVTVSNCTFANNQAIGGGSNAGGAFAGDGAGGGLSNFNGVTATITASTFTGNEALSGAGGAGSNGGDGLGGGFANLLGSALTVSVCTITGNQAVGGVGGPDGNGLGGGLYNDDQSSMTVLGSTITGNSAIGGSGLIAGLGEGGGIYLAPGGLAILDGSTVFGTNHNTATTDGADIFGSYTLI